MHEEKKKSLDNWRNQLGHAKADSISKAATDRGTNTHLLIEKFLKKESINEKDYPIEHFRLFNSLKLELKKINKVYGQEVVLYSGDLRVAGRCDLVGEYQNEIAIIDYKTSTKIKSKQDILDYWLQCAFYLLSHNEMYNTNITKMIIIMGVENGIPLVFKKTISNELIIELIDRIEKFYKDL